MFKKKSVGASVMNDVADVPSTSAHPGPFRVNSKATVSAILIVTKDSLRPTFAVDAAVFVWIAAIRLILDA
jgi:hypothetical protein